MKWFVITAGLVGVIAIATVVIMRPSTASDSPPDSMRAALLQDALAGADRIEVGTIDFEWDVEQADAVVINNAEQISAFVSRLDFDDKRSGMHCMCAGDSLIRFYDGDTLLLELSHHHGIGVRWHRGPWEGDSVFTAESAVLWREWFASQGEPRFEAMHQEQVARAERDKVELERFLSAFKAEVRPLFAKASFAELDKAEKAEGGPTLSPMAAKLFEGYDNRGELAVAMARALGGQSANGIGSWSQSGPKEGLVLHAASALKAPEFRQALDHEDSTVLLGAARLFFFESLARLLPEEERPDYAVKLCTAVLLHDRAGSTASALRLLRRYPSDAVTGLLERVVTGELESTAERDYWDDEPAARYASLVFLASADPERAEPYLPLLAQTNPSEAGDRAAIEIARTLCGESGVLDGSVFELSSYTTGLGALEALAKEGTKRALDVIITAGTEGSYAAVREEAVLTVERMTGKQWYRGRKHERAEWHGKDIRTWWEDHRDTFVMPSP